MIEPIKSGSFTYTHPGGLLNSNVPRADKKTLNHYLNPVRPARKQTWVPPKLTGKWCKAQLAHYGIKPLSGSKQELEKRLRAAYNEGLLKKQPLEMKLLEKYMRAEWRAKREENGNGGGGSNGERCAGGERGGGKKGGGGGKGSKCFKMGVASDDEEVVLFQRVFKEEDGGGIKEEEGAGVFVSSSSSSSSSSATTTTTTISPPISIAPIAPLPTITTTSSSSSNAKSPLHKSGATAFTKKHVFGTWDVACPTITQDWEAEELTFTLMQDADSNTVVGEVDFGVMDGVLRLKSYPSAKNHTVGFYWAGRAGEDGEVQLEARDGEITFFDRGLRAKGRFDFIQGVGRGIKFEARKIAQGPVVGRVDWEVYCEEGAGGIGRGWR
ncbi:hypothetical protein HOY80DRAFT_1057568 [Tuber brumale]|nr:hypothetical protein HOY80DRAFT_1057568 [Tuber brumale]